MNYDDIVNQYSGQVNELTAKYESLKFENVHPHLLAHLPEPPGMVLDIGAGSGRDAAWFASKGFDVVAVEPSALLPEAKRLHEHSRINWLQDMLPDLKKTMRLDISFDVILLSAVWMHVAPSDRSRVFRKLVTLLNPGGIIAISLRHGPHRDIDNVHSVSAIELEKLAVQHGLTFTLIDESDDQLGRENVRWQNAILKFPDDGTGALPLLRHIIINDRKSSTYKLALLRTLVRVADSASGLANITDDHRVIVPLGLVALYWIRLYKPLIENNIPQMSAKRDGGGPKFVGNAFSSLSGVSLFELRVGTEFHGVAAQVLTEAIKNAAQTIREMPANFITYPNSSEQIFKTAGRIKQIRVADRLSITSEYLWSFGEMHVPLDIWRAFSRYAAWIEPSLMFEWTELMRQYSQTHGLAHGMNELMDHLKWLDPERDTSLVRGLVLQMMQSQSVVHCIWSGKPLTRDRFDIDHCFPFAAWPCNDLWNLMPANREVNSNKKDKLVAVSMLNDARERIESFWTGAYFAEPISFEARFRREALASLPLVDSQPEESFFDSMFDAVHLKRVSLKHDHNLTEWVL